MEIQVQDQTRYDLTQQNNKKIPSSESTNKLESTQYSIVIFYTQTLTTTTNDYKTCILRAENLINVVYYILPTFIIALV